MAGAVVLAGGTALAATTPWSPTLGDPRIGHPAPATSPIPEDQLTALGVLRRPQTDRDRSETVRTTLRRLPALEDVGVRTDGVRLLREDSTGSAVLVLLERSGTADADPGHETPTVPDAICIERTLASGGGGEKCGTVDDLYRGRLRTVGYGLVPDGVSTVQVTLKDGTVLDAPVADNYYALPIDLDHGRRGDPELPAAIDRFRLLDGRHLRWLDDAGSEIAKRVPGS